MQSADFPLLVSSLPACSQDRLPAGTGVGFRGTQFSCTLHSISMGKGCYSNESAQSLVTIMCLWERAAISPKNVFLESLIVCSLVKTTLLESLSKNVFKVVFSA
jgi:hypothetical protein